MSNADFLAKQIAAALSQRDLFAEAVLKYGQHMPDCQFHTRAVGHSHGTHPGPCTCGYDHAHAAAVVA